MKGSFDDRIAASWPDPLRLTDDEYLKLRAEQTRRPRDVPLDWKTIWNANHGDPVAQAQLDQAKTQLATAQTQWDKRQRTLRYNELLREHPLPVVTDPPDAAVASPSDPAAGTADPSTGVSTTPGTSAGTPREAKGTSTDLNNLNDTDWTILQTLYDCRAQDRLARTTLSKLEREWRIGNHASRHIKQSVKKLKSMSLICTLSGPSGGIWLTPVGVRLCSERSKGA
jgi:hypothetical protein